MRLGTTYNYKWVGQRNVLASSPAAAALELMHQVVDLVEVHRLLPGYLKAERTK